MRLTDTTSNGLRFFAKAHPYLPKSTVEQDANIVNHGTYIRARSVDDQVSSVYNLLLIALEVEFRDGLTLATSPLAKAEPRLRPTTYGVLRFGPEVGAINLRGRHHMVFETITVDRRTG